MKDDITQIAMRTLESGRVASAFCIGFLFFTFAFIKFGSYMPEVSSTLGTPPLIVSSAVAVICYSAGLISTYVTTWLLPKINNTIYKATLFVTNAISSLVSISKLKAKERNALNSALLQLTENEKKFLALFRKAETLDPLHNQELLPFMVYNAGQSLARQGILTCLTTTPSHDQFTIFPKLKKKVERIVLNGSPMKNFIVLDLKRVQGSQASGGGARGSC
jgi:hypothetical protein